MIQVFYVTYRSAFSVQYSLAAAASSLQLGVNEMHSLVLDGDSTEKGACEWALGQTRSLKAGRKLGKKLKVDGGSMDMWCVILEVTGLFPGKSMVEGACITSMLSIAKLTN